jgi:hypothetical protein
LSVAEFPKVKHLWEDAEHMRSHRVARLLGVLYDERGDMDQEYERHYDSRGGYLGGTIRYADGRVLHANRRRSRVQVAPTSRPIGKCDQNCSNLCPASCPKGSRVQPKKPWWKFRG